MSNFMEFVYMGIVDGLATLLYVDEENLCK